MKKKRRKVGKHRYVSDGMRYEYYLEVAFDNGTVKTLHVSRAVYRNAREKAAESLVFKSGRIWASGYKARYIVTDKVLLVTGLYPLCKKNPRKLKV